MSFLLVLAACADKSPTDSQPTGIQVSQLLSVSGALDASPTANAEADLFVDGRALYRVQDGQSAEVAALPDAQGLVVHPGGEVVYVADGRQVWMVTLATGAAAVVPGSEGLGALALDYVESELLVVGVNGAGAATVSRITSTGLIELVSVVGDPFTGVVGSRGGAVYVAGGDRVLEALSGDTLASGVRLGSPAGLALTPDEGTLLVSSLSASGTAQVLLITLSDLSSTTFDEGLSANSNSGGLHQAPSAPGTYTWADVQTGIYRVQL